MMRLLHYLQSKTSEARSRYAALIAGIVTGAIAVVWVSTIPSRFADVDAPRAEPETGFGDFGALIEDTKTQLGNVITAEDASKANLGRNLNLLGSGETSVSGDSGTTTGEKRVIIETAKVAPKTILIGTTTDSE